MKDYQIIFDDKYKNLEIIFNKKINPKNFLKYEKEFINLYKQYNPASFLIKYKIKDKNILLFGIGYDIYDRKIKIFGYFPKYFLSNLFKEILINDPEIKDFYSNIDLKEITKGNNIVNNLEDKLKNNIYVHIIFDRNKKNIKFNGGYIYKMLSNKEFPWIYLHDFKTKTDIKTFLKISDDIVNNLKSNLEVKLVIKGVYFDIDASKPSKNIFRKLINSGDEIIKDFRDKIFEYLKSNIKINFRLDENKRDENFYYSPFEFELGKEISDFQKIERSDVLFVSSDKYIIIKDLFNIFGSFINPFDKKEIYQNIYNFLKKFKIKNSELFIKYPPHFFKLYKIDENIWKITRRKVYFDNKQMREKFENIKFSKDFPEETKQVIKSLIKMLINNNKVPLLSIC